MDFIIFYFFFSLQIQFFLQLLQSAVSTGWFSKGHCSWSLSHGAHTVDIGPDRNEANVYNVSILYNVGLLGLFTFSDTSTLCIAESWKNIQSSPFPGLNCFVKVCAISIHPTNKHPSGREPWPLAESVAVSTVVLHKLSRKGTKFQGRGVVG